MSHAGWNVKVNHVDGILTVAIPEDGKIRIVAQDPVSKQIMGDMVHPDTEVFVEKTLEMQIKDDLGIMKNQALGWLKKRIR